MKIAEQEILHRLDFIKYDLNQSCPTGGLQATSGLQGVNVQPAGSCLVASIPIILPAVAVVTRVSEAGWHDGKGSELAAQHTSGGGLMLLPWQQQWEGIAHRVCAAEGLIQQCRGDM